MQRRTCMSRNLKSKIFLFEQKKELPDINQGLRRKVMGRADQCQGAWQEEDFTGMNQPSFGLYQNLFQPIHSLFRELTMTLPTSLSLWL